MSLATDPPRSLAQIQARELASRYVEEDGGDPSDADLVDEARQALWLMTVQPEVCREEFPQSVIDAGPWDSRP
jgi:hypothetical protein